MATTNTTVDMALKPQTLDYAVIEVHKEVKNEDGTTSKDISFVAITGVKEIAKAKEAGKLKFEQTVSWDDAGNDEGMKQVIKNEKDRAAVFNAGVKSSRINPRVKRVLEEQDENGNLTFEPIQGAFDIRELINEPAQRRTLTDMEKGVAALQLIFPDKTQAELMNILGAIKASGATVPGIENQPDAVDEEVTA
jgi:hypothetical protein